MENKIKAFEEPASLKQNSIDHNRSAEASNSIDKQMQNIDDIESKVFSRNKFILKINQIFIHTILTKFIRSRRN